MSFLDLKPQADAVLVALLDGEVCPAPVEVLDAAVTVAVTLPDVTAPESSRLWLTTKEAGVRALLRHPDLSANQLDHLAGMCRDHEVLLALLDHPALTDVLACDALWFRRQTGRTNPPNVPHRFRAVSAYVDAAGGAVSAAALHRQLPAVLALDGAAADVFVTLLRDAGSVDLEVVPDLLAAAVALAA